MPEDTVKEVTPELELLELAWGLIANAGGGNWDTQTDEWKAAAEKWRDQYGEIK